MRQRECHAFCGCEAVFAIKNHAVATIQQDDCGTGRFVLALVHHQVAILHLNRDLDALASDGIGKCFTDVQVQCVAKFIGARDAPRFHAGREITRIVPAKTAAAKGTKKILQRFEAKEVYGFVGDLEARIRAIPDVQLVLVNIWSKEKPKPPYSLMPRAAALSEPTPKDNSAQ